MIRSANLNRKDKIFLAVSFFYILYVIFPLFADYTHIPVSVPAIVVVAGVMISCPQVLRNSAVKSFVAYIVLLFVYSGLGLPIYINGMDHSLSAIWRITIEAAWILPAILIAAALTSRNDQRMYKIIGYGSLALLAISFVYILPLVMSASNILREDVQDLESLRPVGLPDYSLMHSYTLMIVPLCLLIRGNKGKYKILAWILTFLFFYMVTQTAITTSLLLLVVIFLFAILYKENSGWKTVMGLVASSLILFVLYSQGFFLWLVDGLMPYFEGTSVSYKLQDFHYSLIQGSITGSSITGRIDYHGISKNSFWENPIIGGGEVGGHSKILDILGSMGLLVFVPFAMIIWKSMRMQIARVSYSKEMRAFLILGYAISFVYLYEKGVFGASGWLFMTVIVPCAILAQSKEA